MADYLTRCSDRVSEDDILRSAATVRHNLNALTEWKKVQIITHIFYNYILCLYRFCSQLMKKLLLKHYQTGENC